mgnify:CR=1 FL=1
MHQDIERVLISEQELAARIAELGKQVAADYADKDPIFLGILKGVVMFFSDMIRATPIQCQIDFMAVSSYGGGTSTSGKVRMLKDVSVDLRGRHVVILEDILDSGNTLAFLKDYFMTKGAASITIVTLLDKPSRRTKAITADLAGFVVPDEFVVGYGLDYCQQYRNMPYIGVLKPEVYSK